MSKKLIRRPIRLDENLSITDINTGLPVNSNYVIVDENTDLPLSMDDYDKGDFIDLDGVRHFDEVVVNGTLPKTDYYHSPALASYYRKMAESGFDGMEGDIKLFHAMFPEFRWMSPSQVARILYDTGKFAFNPNFSYDLWITSVANDNSGIVPTKYKDTPIGISANTVFDIWSPITLTKAYNSVLPLMNSPYLRTKLRWPFSKVETVYHADSVPLLTRLETNTASSSTNTGIYFTKDPAGVQTSEAGIRNGVEKIAIKVDTNHEFPDLGMNVNFTNPKYLLTEDSPFLMTVNKGEPIKDAILKGNNILYKVIPEGDEYAYILVKGNSTINLSKYTVPEMPKSEVDYVNSLYKDIEVTPIGVPEELLPIMAEATSKEASMLDKYINGAVPMVNPIDGNPEYTQYVVFNPKYVTLPGKLLPVLFLYPAPLILNDYMTYGIK